jgi:hypothetical protein
VCKTCVSLKELRTHSCLAVVLEKMETLEAALIAERAAREQLESKVAILVASRPPVSSAFASPNASAARQPQGSAAAGPTTSLPLAGSAFAAPGATLPAGFNFNFQAKPASPSDGSGSSADAIAKRKQAASVATARPAVASGSAEDTVPFRR